MNIKSIKLITAISTIGVLTACAGGGGGGGGSSGAAMPSGCCSLYQTPDVRAAYAAGYTGKGVTVLNLDWSTHMSPNGKTHLENTNGVIAGPGGVATDATLVPVNFNGQPSSATNWVNVISNTLQGMTSGQILNISAYTAGSTSATVNTPSNKPNVLITMSAGNNNIPTLSYNEVSAVFNSGYRENLIIVGAADPTTGNIASWSATAGGAADRFVIDNGQSTSGYQGTSYSAPRVAGYAAIIQQKFPNSTSSQIAQAILDTAIMKPGWDPAVYGRGQANLAGALSPQGKLK